MPRFKQFNRSASGVAWEAGSRGIMNSMKDIAIIRFVNPLREALDRRLAVGADLKLSTTDRFLEWWVLAGLWHDIGYIFEATNFLTDESLRRRQLEALASKLNEHVFLTGLAGKGIELSPSAVRGFYQAGHYFPFRLDSLNALFGDRGVNIIDNMWSRVLLTNDVPPPSFVRELDRLTTQAVAGRPPYHDHGFFAALLLSYLVDEVTAFLTNLVDSGWSASGGNPTSRQREEWWEEFVSSESIQNLAIEAVAFHNFNPTTIDPGEFRSLFKGRVPIALSAEPGWPGGLR